MIKHLGEGCNQSGRSDKTFGEENANVESREQLVIREAKKKKKFIINFAWALTVAALTYSICLWKFWGKGLHYVEAKQKSVST